MSFDGNDANIDDELSEDAFNELIQDGGGSAHYYALTSLFYIINGNNVTTVHQHGLSEDILIGKITGGISGALTTAGEIIIADALAGAGIGSRRRSRNGGPLYISRSSNLSSRWRYMCCNRSFFMVEMENAMKKQNYYIVTIILFVAPMVAILTYYRNTMNILIQLCIALLIGLFLGLFFAIINIAQTILSTLKQSKDTILPVKYKGDCHESKFTFDPWVGEQLERICRRQVEPKDLPFSEEMSADKVIRVNKQYSPVSMGGIIKVNGEFYYINENTRSLLQQGKEKEGKGYRLPDELQKYFSDIL